MDVRAAKEAIERAGDGGDDSRMHFLLWKASGDARHIKAAKLHLDFQVEHAPEECRESMLKNVRLHLEIMEAWERLDGRAAVGGPSARPPGQATGRAR